MDWWAGRCIGGGVHELGAGGLMYGCVSAQVGACMGALVGA